MFSSIDESGRYAYGNQPRIAQWNLARLAETLGAWLRHQGRREGVARELHVHPQTVRYRMNQVRQRLGTAVDDPRQHLDLLLACNIATSVELSS